MKNLFKQMLFIGVFLGICSCSDFLDRRPDSLAFTEDEIFTDYVSAVKFIDQLFAPWTYFDDWDMQNQNDGLRGFTHGKQFYGLRERVTDNCIGSDQNAWVGGTYWRSGNQAAGQNDVFWSEGSNLRYETMWRAIRVCNISIANVDLIENATAEQKARILGPAYFCRGHFYFMLLIGWGGMPYVTEPLDPAQNMDLTRLSYTETAQMIAKDFETAADYLPMIVENINMGLPSKMSAIAYRAKALTWAASPYANPDNNRQLWVDAAVACAEAITMAENSGYYKLIDFSLFKRMFTECVDETFQEVLFGRYWEAYRLTMSVYHVGIKSQEFGNHSWGGESVFENLAQCFYWSNGEPIDTESDEYKTKPFEGIGSANGGHDRRDPRFYESILYNGARTPQTDATGRTVEIWNQNDYDGVGSRELVLGATGNVLDGYTYTGYYDWKMWCNTYASTGTRYLRIMWNIIRLADIYLYYAETANRAWGPTGSPTGTPGGFSLTAVQSLNKIRERCGMPLFSAEASQPWLRPGDQQEFEKQIRNEFRVETCFEDKRWWDIRRWRLVDDPSITQMWGMYITRTGENDFTYQRVRLSSRDLMHADRHHLFRIKDNDVYLGPNFIQNPGY